MNSPSYALDTFAADSILEQHQWLNERDHHMVLGDDIDSVMCGVLMHHLLNWRVVGFYTDYSRVWHPDGINLNSLRNAVWLDLDISRQEIRSVGHHVLLTSGADNLAFHQYSVNPNLFRGVTGRPGRSPGGAHGQDCPCGGRTFPHKYPLGTIHFLLWLFGVNLGNNGSLRAGWLWLPDSSWISGQSHRYRLNVLDWVRNWIPHPALVGTADLIDTEEFEGQMRDTVFGAVEAVGFGRGTGQVTSRHLRLGGHQCQFGDPNRDHGRVQALADLVADVFKWSRLEIPSPPYRTVEGDRNPVRQTLVTMKREFGDLDRFVRRQRVFSYAIPNAGRINYTLNIPL